MLTLYWIPRENDPLPRLMVFDEKERRIQVPGIKVKEFPGALKYTIPDNQKNRERYEAAREPWHKELPKQVSQSKTSQKTIDSVESSLIEDSIVKTPLTREELIEMLDNNGIAFKKNQKTTTLFEKLPDDINRNFQLVESGLEVQT